MVRGWPCDGSIFVADLGTDEIARYWLGEADGVLQLAEAPVRTHPGLGPRHFVFHPSGRMFVVTELVPRVVTVTVGPDGAGPAVTGEAATTSGEATSVIAPSAIVCSPDERFLYVANRGPDTIAVFRIDDAGPVLIAEVESGGEPRDMVFANGFLYVANMASDNIAVFAHDQGSGLLTGPDQVVAVPAPSCLLPLQEALP